MTKIRAVFQNTVVFVLACSILVGCGGSGSSSPSGPSASWSGPNLTGIWIGRWTYVTDGINVADDATVTFALNGPTMVGQLQTMGGVSGTVTLTDGMTLGGTLSLAVGALAGVAACTANGTIVGTLVAEELRLSGTGVAGACSTWASDHTFVLKKQ